VKGLSNRLQNNLLKRQTELESVSQSQVTIQYTLVSLGDLDV
jgi:hypothetical protein